MIHFHLLLGAGDMDFLVEPELHRLLEAIDHVVAGQEQDDRVRIGRLRLDQIGGEVGGAERRVVGAELGAVGGLQARFEALLQRVAEGVVGGDEVPLLAVGIEQQLGNRIGLHARRVADAEHVPVALRAGDESVWPPGTMWKTLFSMLTFAIACASAELMLPSRKSTWSRSISLLAFCTATAASPLVESSTRRSTWRPRMPPLALICSTASCAPISSFLPTAANGAGQRIVETDFDSARRAPRLIARAGDLHGAEREPGLEYRAGGTETPIRSLDHHVPP